MAYVKTDNTHYTRIAGAIRALHEGEETYTPAEMGEYLATEGAGLKPWNIAKGITIFGVTGTLEFAPSGDWPDDLPIDEDDADNALDDLLPDDGVGDEDKGDKFVLADDKGNVTIAYMMGEAFTMTSYDYATTEFKAIGWIRLSYHTTGENAGQFTLDDFRTVESGGWNYLRNIRSCTREALYYNGVQIWPEPMAYLYNGEKLPDINSAWADKETYPYAVIGFLTYSNSDSTKVQLQLAHTLLSKVSDYEGFRPYEIHFGPPYVRYDYNAESNAWVRSFGPVTGGIDWDWNFDRMIWSNVDIYHDNGNLFSSASEPVPVYE